MSTRGSTRRGQKAAQQATASTSSAATAASGSRDSTTTTGDIQASELISLDDSSTSSLQQGTTITTSSPSTGNQGSSMTDDQQGASATEEFPVFLTSTVDMDDESLDRIAINYLARRGYGNLSGDGRKSGDGGSSAVLQALASLNEDGDPALTRTAADIFMDTATSILAASEAKRLASSDSSTSSSSSTTPPPSSILAADTQSIASSSAAIPLPSTLSSGIRFYKAESPPPEVCMKEYTQLRAFIARLRVDHLAQAKELLFPVFISLYLVSYLALILCV